MKKALLIIDVQKGFINEPTKHIPKLVESIQSDYEHVIITKFYNEEKSPYRSLINWNRFSINSKDTELAFTPRQDALIIEKPIYTCVNDKFLTYLQNHNITTIDICGIDTDICVTKCAVDLFEKNFIPKVLGKYCSSHAGKEHHDFALKILKRYIGKDQVVDET